MQSGTLPFSQIGQVIRDHQRFVVMSHYRPDGDAIGSTLAMALCLKQLGKDVTAWNQDPVPDRYAFLRGTDLIMQPPAVPQDFEVAIIVDTAVRDRVGTCDAALRSAKICVNIDHHVSNPGFGDVVCVDGKAPSAAEVLFELFQAADLPITYEMADALYVGMSTDTGSFQYPSTTARTYEIAAALIRMGVNVGEINQACYQNQPRRALKLLGALTQTLAFDANDRIASCELSQATAKELGLIPGDTEDMIDNIRRLEGVVVAAFFEETPQGAVRVSLRSKAAHIDVSKICMHFGGGGHRAAAGARLDGPLAQARRLVLERITHEFS